MRHPRAGVYSFAQGHLFFLGSVTLARHIMSADHSHYHRAEIRNKSDSRAALPELVRTSHLITF
jgi:hypothetical protein